MGRFTPKQQLRIHESIDIKNVFCGNSAAVACSDDNYELFGTKTKEANQQAKSASCALKDATTQQN